MKKYTKIGKEFFSQLNMYAEFYDERSRGENDEFENNILDWVKQNACKLSNQADLLVMPTFTKDEYEYLWSMILSWDKGIKPDAIDKENIPKYLEKLEKLSKSSA